MTAPPTLAAAITGEDAAIYAYGIVGAYASGAWTSRARRALAAHRAARERWQALADEPVPTPPAFDLPVTVVDIVTARELAGLVERRLAALYAELAARAAAEQRAQAVTDAMACAARSVVWSGATQAFPHG